MSGQYRYWLVSNEYHDSGTFVLDEDESEEDLLLKLERGSWRMDSAGAWVNPRSIAKIQKLGGS